MTDEREAIAKVRSTFGELEAHRERWSVATPPPAGSALAADDEAWPSNPLSSHVRQCLTCAWDHFDLIKLTIDQERGYPTATFSVIRGALLGSAQALWLLLPEEPSARRERGLAVSQEWYSKRIQWQCALSPDLNVEDAARSGEQLRRLDKDLAAVLELRSKKFTLNSTLIIEEAAKASFDGARFVREATREWRRLGGDAHALGWPLLGQNTTWGERGPDGLSEATVVGNLVSVANAYLLAWTIYQRAIDRHDELATL